MRAVLRSTALVGFLLTTPLACMGLGGLTGGEDSIPDSSTTTGPDGGPCEGEGCLPDAVSVIYVAADGSDTNTGKEKTAPKRTIGAALALLKTVGAANYEIHVCRGQYAESITLDYATKILGGYECSTWQRNTPDNEVIVTAAPGAPALTVKGVVDAVVDGVTLRASDAAGDRSRAVHVLDDASVILIDDKIVAAGGTVKASPASIGVFVDGGGAEIRGCTIEGGSAANEGSGYGSAGIYVVNKPASTLRIASSTVEGGSGSVASGTGSVGILALGGKVPQFEKSTVKGGAGKGVGGSASVGVLLAVDGDLAFVDNVIDGGAGSCTASCSVTAVSLRTKTKGTLRVTGNRVFGGELSTPGNEARFTAMTVSDAGTADVQNNQIFTGNTKRVITSTATGLAVRYSGTTLVAQNTVIVGSTLLGTGTALEVSASSATIVSNLLVNAGGTTDPGMRISACSERKVATFRDNAVVGFSSAKPMLAIDQPGANPILCTQSATTATTMASAESALSAAFPGMSVGNDVEVASTAETIFGGWDAATAGGLLTTGWKLGPDAPCTIAKGTGDVAPGLIAKDAYGTARTDPRSIGAHESEGACK